MERENWEVPQWMFMGVGVPPAFSAYCRIFHRVPDEPHPTAWTTALRDAGIEFDPQQSYWDLRLSPLGEGTPWNEEGILPNDQLALVLEQLSEWTWTSRCHAYYSCPPAGFGAPDEPTWTGQLGEVADLTRRMENHTPNYLFASGMPWCLYTYCDGHETIVAGPEDLIERVIGVQSLDAHRYSPEDDWADGSRIVWIEPEFSASGLWERSAGQGVSTNPDLFPLSAETRTRLSNWVEQFDCTYDPDTCAFPSDEAKVAFERESWDIWREVRDQLPPVFEVGNVLLYNRTFFGDQAEIEYRRQGT